MLTATDPPLSQQPPESCVSISKNEILGGQKMSFRKKKVYSDSQTELMGKKVVILDSGRVPRNKKPPSCQTGGIS